MAEETEGQDAGADATAGGADAAAVALAFGAAAQNARVAAKAEGHLVTQRRLGYLQQKFLANKEHLRFANK